MGDILSYLFHITGLVLLILGYRRNNRDMLLAAATCLLVGGGIEDFVQGFMEAMNRA